MPLTCSCQQPRSYAVIIRHPHLNLQSINSNIFYTLLLPQVHIFLPCLSYSPSLSSVPLSLDYVPGKCQGIEQGRKDKLALDAQNLQSMRSQVLKDMGEHIAVRLKIMRSTWKEKYRRQGVCIIRQSNLVSGEKGRLS